MLVAGNRGAGGQQETRRKSYDARHESVPSMMSDIQRNYAKGEEVEEGLDDVVGKDLEAEYAPTGCSSPENTRTVLSAPHSS